MNRLLLGIVICAGLFGATLLGGKLAAPAGAQETTTTTPTPSQLESELTAALASLEATQARLAEARSAVRRQARLRLRWKRAHHRVDRLLHPYSSQWLAAAMCVHSREGAWDDPNSPYYGGMQMSLSFQQANGREFYRALGTADRWHPDQQLLAAWRGYLAAGGWNPWPNTGAACGLPMFV